MAQCRGTVPWPSQYHDIMPLPRQYGTKALPWPCRVAMALPWRCHGTMATHGTMAVCTALTLPCHYGNAMARPWHYGSMARPWHQALLFFSGNPHCSACTCVYAHIYKCINVCVYKCICVRMFLGLSIGVCICAFLGAVRHIYQIYLRASHPAARLSCSD